MRSSIWCCCRPRRCALDRVYRRVEHGFTDLAATAHMYRQFADVDIDARHVITADGAPAADIASSIPSLITRGSLQWAVDSAASSPG